jgi:radical SAM protein with 4Fe4S-binding SPASM domain
VNESLYYFYRIKEVMNGTKHIDFETEVQFMERIHSPFSKDKLLDNFRPKSLLLQWHISNQCNLRCKHCYQDEYGANTDLSFNQQLQILDQYTQWLANWKIRGHINLTGGEPLVNNHLFSLLENISLYSSLCSFAILSNGVALTPSIAKHLKELGCKFFQISVEGGLDIHDNIRGTGNFEKCIRAIEILRRYKIQTMVSFTSSKLNIDSFDEVVKFCRKHKVDILWSDRYLPMGQGKEMKDALLHPAEVEAFFAKMYQWHHKLNKSWFHKTELRMHRALHFLTSQEQGCNCYAPYKCSAGRSLLTILPNGDLVPCRRLPIVVGNVMETRMSELYENSMLLKMLRKNNIHYRGCEKCVHWKDCQGGLRCLSYAYHGNPFIADPQCFKIHSVLPDMDQNSYI